MKNEVDDVQFGRCNCGAALIPIWNDWWDDNKHIRGIDCFRCPECLQDSPASPDFDTILETRQSRYGTITLYPISSVACSI